MWMWMGLTGSVPPAELQVLYEALAGSPGALLRHGSVMQLATAAFEALSGPSAATWDTMARQEKQLQLTSLEGLPVSLQNTKTAAS